MAKVKKKVIVNVTLEQAQEASERFAGVSTTLSMIEAQMNEKINNIKSKYQEQITSAQEQLEEHAEVLQVFASEQKKNWGNKKSLDLLHCTIGFRKGNPKVDKAKKFTWDAVVELLKKHKKLAEKFIRTKEEVNKEAILAEKDEKVLEQLQEDAFIFINQDETFYVEPKKEEVAA